MNTIGKVLVVLVFLVAVIHAGILVIDFARRTNMKTAYDDLKREYDVIKASRDAFQTVAQNSLAREKETTLKNEKLNQDLKDAEDTAKVKKADADRIIAELTAKNTDAGLTTNLTQSEQARLTTEVADKVKTIALREKAINVLEGERNKYRQEAIALEGGKRTLQARNEQLTEELQRLTTQLHRLQVASTSGPSGGGDAPLLRGPKEPNPPQVRVNGKIERVAEGKGGLVQLSLGTDQGVNMNNTLYAYRTRPEPTYLGMIRIVEAFHNRSVGRLETGAGQLREGDLVSSDLGGR